MYDIEKEYGLETNTGLSTLVVSHAQSNTFAKNNNDFNGISLVLTMRNRKNLYVLRFENDWNTKFNLISIINRRTVTI